MPHKDHNAETPQEKPHHHGAKEMPSSLPNQKVSSDGKKMPLVEQTPKEDSKT